jgi:hypothetical protein
VPRVEGNSCSSAAPRIASTLCHHLSASPLSSPAHATPLRRCPSRQQLVAIDRRAVLLPSIVIYLNLNQDCCGPLSPAHLLSSSFPRPNTAAAIERHCRRSGPPSIACPTSSQSTPTPPTASPCSREARQPLHRHP